MPNLEKVIRGLECCTESPDTIDLEDCRRCPYMDEKNCSCVVMRDALAILREMEPLKPKKGVWLHPISLDCCCSVCGRQPEHEPGESVPLYLYCPYCGAKMEVKWNA